MSDLINQFFALKEESTLDRLKQKYKIESFEAIDNGKPYYEHSHKYLIWKINDNLYAVEMGYGYIDNRFFVLSATKDDSVPWTEYKFRYSNIPENIKEFLTTYIKWKHPNAFHFETEKEWRKDNDFAQKAIKFIKVDILEAHFNTAYMFADSEPGNYEDDEGHAKIKVSVGNKEIFTAIVPYGIEYHVDSVGDVEPVNSTTTEDLFFEDSNGNEFDPLKYKDLVPEGKLRDIYVKYLKCAVIDALDDYCPQ